MVEAVSSEPLHLVDYEWISLHFHLHEFRVVCALVSGLMGVPDGKDGRSSS